MNQYFPEPGFAANAWFKGTYEAGHLENSFDVVDMWGGSRAIFVVLQFGPLDAAPTRAYAIAKRYASLPAIVVTYAYSVLGRHVLRPRHASRLDAESPPLSGAIALCETSTTERRFG